jgi:glutaredoxin
MQRKNLLRALSVVVLFAVIAVGTAWGVRELERHRLGERVAAAAEDGDIQMYSATTCGICKTAKKWFTAHDVPVTLCEIDRDAECRQRFRELRGKGTPLFVVRGERQVGFDRERIAAALERSGS